MYQHKYICEEGTITLIDRNDFASGKETITPEIDGFEEEEENQQLAYDAMKGIRYSQDPSKILYFINYARLYYNLSAADEFIGQQVGFLLIYIILIVFTTMFAFRYMKRVIYIAFLTLMAPLVALTYPIDKIKDR